MFYNILKINKITIILLVTLLFTMPVIVAADQCPTAYINYAIQQTPQIMDDNNYYGKATPVIIGCYYDPKQKFAKISMQLNWTRFNIIGDFSPNKKMWIKGDLYVTSQGHQWKVTEESKRVKEQSVYMNLITNLF